MIICCGESLIDMVPYAAPGGELAYRPVPGGAVFNTAVALGRLDQRVGLITGLSRDLFGRQLSDFLKASNVDTSLSVFSNRPTTLAFVKLVDGRAEYLFYDENSASRMVGKEDLPAIPKQAEALHFGAISLISEPCGSSYEGLAAEHHQERIISLDPNIRPGFVTDEKAYRSRLERMIAISDIIKISTEDLEWLHPGLSFDEVARSWLHGGAALVVETAGELGARALTQSFETNAAGQQVDVVDTIGAGDAFDAGLLAGLQGCNRLKKKKLALITRNELDNALEYANRIAARTVQRQGADPPWWHEIGEQS